MKYLLSFLLLLFISTVSFSQNIDTTLVHGVQFQLPNILKISNFDGYTFSYRYKQNKTSTYRFGISTNIRYRKTDLTSTSDTLSINYPKNDNSYVLKLSVQYLKSIMSYKNYSLIIGGGPFVTYDYRESNYHSIQNDNILKSHHSQKGFGIGLDFLSGVEYQLIRNIIISGEYSLSMIWKTSKIEAKQTRSYNDSNKTEIIGKNSGTTTELGLYGNRVNFGIAIYF